MLFRKNMTQLLNEIEKCNYELSFLCGDFNYDLLKSLIHKPMQEYLLLLDEHKYIPYINKQTRITHKSATLIDNIYVQSKSIKPNVSLVIVDGMSDHYLCLLAYTLKPDKGAKEWITIEKRKLNAMSLLKVQHDLLFHDWTCINILDTEHAYQYFMERITKSLDNFAPKKLVRICRDEKFHEPWLTVELMKYNAKCRKLCKKARESRKESDFAKYKQYRNTLNRLKLHIKRKHYDDLFKKIGKNLKLLWNVVNGLLKKSNNKTEIIELRYNDELYTKQEKICNAFNEHFISARKKGACDHRLIY